MTNPLVSFSNLNISFNMLDDSKVYAVNGINLDIYPNDIIGIVGESGSGKSQMAMSIMGILASNANMSGTISYNDKIIVKDGKYTDDLNKIRGSDISMIFQDPMTCLNPYLKISTQMLELALKDNKDIKIEEAKKLCIELMDLMGITDSEKRFNSYPHNLSGGMRQRIMIAMALINKPKLLIADEPTTALDVTVQMQIIDLLKDVQKRTGLTIILITHDMGIISSLCNRVAVMYGGRIIESGSINEIFYNTAHPYTKALLNTIPNIDSDRSVELNIIDGLPPMLKSFPKYCTFKDRCRFVHDKCGEAEPELENVSGNHLKACFYKGKM